MYGKPIPVVANPTGTGGLRFLLVEFDLCLDDSLTIPIIDTNMSRINDAVLQLLGTKSIEDIRKPISVRLLKHELAEGFTEAIPERIVES